MPPDKECVEVWEFISLALDGELNKVDGEKITEHIENCDDEDCDLCNEILEDLYAVKSIFVRKRRKMSEKIKSRIFSFIRNMEENKTQ